MDTARITRSGMSSSPTTSNTDTYHSDDAIDDVESNRNRQNLVIDFNSIPSREGRLDRRQPVNRAFHAVSFEDDVGWERVAETSSPPLHSDVDLSSPDDTKQHGIAKKKNSLSEFFSSFYKSKEGKSHSPGKNKDPVSSPKTDLRSPFLDMLSVEEENLDGSGLAMSFEQHDNVIKIIDDDNESQRSFYDKELQCYRRGPTNFSSPGDTPTPNILPRAAQQGEFFRNNDAAPMPQTTYGKFLMWWRQWKVSALFGLFGLFFIIEVVSIGCVLVISSISSTNVMNTYQGETISVIQNLSIANAGALDNAFDGIRVLLLELIVANVTVFVLSPTSAAFAVRDSVLSTMANPPIYTTIDQMSPANAVTFESPFTSFLRYLKEEYEKQTYTVGVGFDDTGNIWSIVSNRLSVSANSPQPYYLGYPVYNHTLTDGYCNVPGNLSPSANYVIGTPNCTQQAWFYQQCLLTTNDTVCNTSYIQDLTPYNVLIRPWYVPTKQYNTPPPPQPRPGFPIGLSVWSPVYQFASGNVLGITFGSPIIRNDGTFVGVSFVDIYLDDLSNFLNEVNTVKSGVVYIVAITNVTNVYTPTIVAESGKLIAWSGATNNKNDSNLQLQNAAEASDPSIRTSAQVVLSKYNSWMNVPLSGNLTYNQSDPSSASCNQPLLPGSNYSADECITVTWKNLDLVYPGLNWTIFVYIPESVYLSAAEAAAQDADKQINTLSTNASQDIDRSLRVSGGLAAVFIVLSGAVAYFISYGFSKPLRDLSRDMKSIAKLDFHPLRAGMRVTARTQKGKKYRMGFIQKDNGDGTFQVQFDNGLNETAISKRNIIENSSEIDQSRQTFKTRIREVAEMNNSYVNMKKGLEGFAKFVPEAVVRRIISGDEKASTLYVCKRKVTVLFSDIKNFTTIAEKMDLKDVVALLGDYLRKMVEIVEETDGTVGDFIGDGIMVFWNSPDIVQDHPGKACECALLMHKKMESFNDKWRAKGFPEISTRIGIHTGEVLSGNIGSRIKMKFGVVGDTVNLASRVENMNKYYQSSRLISESVVDAIQKPNEKDDASKLDRFLVRPVDKVKVKGKDESTTLYELMCYKKDASQMAYDLAARTKLIFNKYQERQFEEAVFLATEALSKFPNDGVILKLRQHSEKFIHHQPPKSWNGITAYEEK